MRKMKIAVFFLVAMSAVSSAWPVLAMPSGQAQVTMTASGGFGEKGSYLIGEWFPVRVVLSNPSGGSSMRVRVQVDSTADSATNVAGTYAREVDLPTPSRKEVTLYAYAGQFSNAVDVRLFQGGTQISSVSVKLDPLEQPSNTIVGVISSDDSLLNILSNEQVGHTANVLLPQYYGGPGSMTNPNPSARATIAHLKPADIPTLPVALNSLGALVIEDVETSALQDEQRLAISSWVARGGTLVAASRVGGADTMSGLADLLPVTVSGTGSVSSIKGMADLVGLPSAAGGPAPVLNSTLKTAPEIGARVLALQDGVPLVVTRGLGRGQVVYMALSPGVAPLKNWEGLLPLFKRLLAEHTVDISQEARRRFNGSSGYYASPSGIFNTYGGLFDVPSLDLPDATLFGLFLFVYIMIIGPVNFIILRRVRRTELAWLTIPVLVALFSVGAYALAYQSKGGDLVAIRANIVELVPGMEQGTATHQLGLFSPVRRTYNLDVGADSAITELNAYGYGGGASNPAQVFGGNPTSVRDVSINTWSLKGFMAENTVQVRPALEADLHLGDNIIEGTVRNRTTEALQDVALVRGDAVQYLGYIAPGQSSSVRLAISNSAFNNNSPASLLPPPSGVTAPNGNYYPNGQQNTPEQRGYNRKVEVLSMGLSPFASADPPSDMSVVALAWGPTVPPDFVVNGYTTRSEDLNLWVSRVPVVGAGAANKARLSAGLVPFSVYAPGNNPAWQAGRSAAALPANSTLQPVPTVQTQPGSPPATSIPFSSSQSVSGVANSVTAQPYVDLQFRLPAGLQAESLTLHRARNSPSDQVAVLAYNVRTGVWDSLDSPGDNTPATITNSGSYTGIAGDVTIRLVPRGSTATLDFSTFSLGLNEAP